MANYTKYNTIIKNHPDCFVLVIPVKNDKVTHHVVGWKVLQTVLTVDDCEKCLDYCEAEGFEKVVVIPTYREDDRNAPELPSDIAAKLFRVLYGKE